MKYYIWALGCAMNRSDAERIASVFEATGYTQTNSESEADFIVTIACSVRQHAIDRIYGKAREWQKRKQKEDLVTILSGCVLDKDKITMSKFFDLIFDINNVSKLAQFLEKIDPMAASSSSEVKDLEILRQSLRMTESNNFFSIRPKFNSTFQAYIPISTGCNNFCTYCAVPYTRGREVSRPMSEIIEEVKGLVQNGYKEITLLGQNVNSYGHDFPSAVIPSEAEESLKKQRVMDLSTRRSTKSVEMTNHFSRLIQAIDKIPGDWRGYFYSNHPKDFSDELIETISKLKHFPHYIHLPLQSGSDKIIKVMNRHYTQKQYLGLVKKIKNKIPEVTITTDIIVGFPGETEADFNQTKKVIKEVGFDMIYISKFSPRPGTKAAKMENNVSQKVKEKRWQKITDLLKRYLEKENKKYVGMVMKVLIDAEKNGKYYGRTDNYKVVELQNDVQPRTRLNIRKQTGPMGQLEDIKITASEAWMLKGEVI